jgi:release factor glutamine methyltransferase
MRSLQRTKPRDWQPSRAEHVYAHTLGSLLAEVTTALSRAGLDDARRRARRAVAAVLDIPPVEILAHPERVLDDQQVDSVRLAFDRLLGREPLSRIVGRREFWGLEFMLSADTLDPRPETETIVEAVLRRFPDRSAPLRLLDLGTGTGCILLALLAEFPNASGFGVDLSAGATTTARRNASSLGLVGHSHFFIGDWGTAISGKFDAIVANPPYIPTDRLAQLPPEVRLYDPRVALDGGRDGLDSYRALATDVGNLLGPQGIFIAEIGSSQAPAVTAILRARGLIIEGLERDLAGICRCVVARAGAPQQEKGWNAPPSRLGWPRSGARHSLGKRRETCP